MRRRVSNDKFGRKVLSILDDGPPGVHRYPQADQRGSSWTKRERESRVENGFEDRWKVKEAR